MVYALVISRLDYCKALYMGLPLRSFWKPHWYRIGIKWYSEVSNKGTYPTNLEPSTQPYSLFPKVQVLTFQAIYSLGTTYLRTTYSHRNAPDHYGHLQMFYFSCPSLLKLGRWQPGEGLLGHSTKALELCPSGTFICPLLLPFFCHYMKTFLFLFGCNQMAHFDWPSPPVRPIQIDTSGWWSWAAPEVEKSGLKKHWLKSDLFLWDIPGPPFWAFKRLEGVVQERSPTEVAIFYQNRHFRAQLCQGMECLLVLERSVLGCPGPPLEHSGVGCLTAAFGFLQWSLLPDPCFKLLSLCLVCIFKCCDEVCMLLEGGWF